MFPEPVSPDLGTFFLPGTSKKERVIREVELEKLLEEAADVADAYDKAKFYREKVVSKMKELRAFADELEKLVDKKAWPFPTYEDLLFRL